MNCVCLLGSPRTKGNSATLAARFTQTAQSLGADVQTFALNELSFQGCQACFACKGQEEECILEDDLREVLQAIQACDCLVLASPIYFGDVTAQTKAFIDRSFSFLRPDFKTSAQPGRLSGDKHLVFILTQGDPDEESFKDVYPKYARFLKMEGYAQTHLIRGCGLMGPDDAAGDETALRQAEELARQLFS
jgi:multimeric flavodoxin WrbA